MVKMSAHNNKKNKGLTLIELLVTLVILSFTIALISGALSQISHIIKISSDQNNGFLSRWNKTRSLHDLISNMVIDQNLENPFTGNSKNIKMVSVAAPEMPRGIPYLIKLEIKKINNSYVILSTLEDISQQKILTDFPNDIEFLFIDHQGKENTSWPPNSLNEYRPMPSSIIIRDMKNSNELLKFANYDGEWSPPSSGIADFMNSSQ